MNIRDEKKIYPHIENGAYNWKFLSRFVEKRKEKREAAAIA